MCRRVTCSTCFKPTYAGCGAHIEQVLGNVPAKDRCHCREDAAAAEPPPRATGSFWQTLFGKPSAGG